MQDLLDYIVKALVSKPDEVKIQEDDADGNINLQLSVAPEDMGLIIGKGGQTIKAIRKVLVVRAMAENPQARVFLNLEDKPEKPSE